MGGILHISYYAVPSALDSLHQEQKGEVICEKLRFLFLKRLKESLAGRYAIEMQSISITQVYILLPSLN